jgi:hypothetical protein
MGFRWSGVQIAPARPAKSPPPGTEEGFFYALTLTRAPVWELRWELRAQNASRNRACGQSHFRRFAVTSSPPWTKGGCATPTSSLATYGVALQSEYWDVSYAGARLGFFEVAKRSSVHWRTGTQMGVAESSENRNRACWRGMGATPMSCPGTFWGAP